MDDDLDVKVLDEVITVLGSDAHLERSLEKSFGKLEVGLLLGQKRVVESDAGEVCFGA